jgi:hypothetical protein
MASHTFKSRQRRGCVPRPARRTVVGKIRGWLVVSPRPSEGFGGGAAARYGEGQEGRQAFPGVRHGGATSCTSTTDASGFEPISVHSYWYGDRSRMSSFGFSNDPLLKHFRFSVTCPSRLTRSPRNTSPVTDGYHHGIGNRRSIGSSGRVRTRRCRPEGFTPTGTLCATLLPPWLLHGRWVGAPATRRANFLGHLRGMVAAFLAYLLMRDQIPIAYEDGLES